MSLKLAPIAFLAILLIGCSNNDHHEVQDQVNGNDISPAIINYSVLNTYPHDTTFFTEGLEYHDGKLFESSGGNKEETPHPSAFGIADLKTGKVATKVQLDNSVYFGEGITFFNGKVYQLTWQNHKGFVYDSKTFKKIKEFDYPGDGWALTHDSSHLIMSDGTSNLQFLDPESLKVVRTLTVSDNNGPVSNINELEYIDGFIYSNQWQSNYILKIDPATGKVVGKIDLSTLDNEARNKYPAANVLNGIAYNPDKKSIFVTGKQWPLIYEIKLQ